MKLHYFIQIYHECYTCSYFKCFLINDVKLLVAIYTLQFIIILLVNKIADNRFYM